MDLEIKPQLRPCLVSGRKALFHRWVDRAEIVAPSSLVGGHPGGQLWIVLGVVEYDDGQVAEAYPSSIKFLDNPFKEFAFDLPQK